ncbi:hypothetical protein OKW33_005933 [Paraburkholderia atlantica]|uniref:hypothetical protein n=1 Tax=Paraburkholderia atlantica TaxID=2654982 RepID=UPI0003640684|nr:hypothetical protein [Paraburkholderia atlantica]MPW11539.1 hypothetical protein [Paraburkholderia atlantica]
MHHNRFAKAESKKYQPALCILLGVSSIEELLVLFKTAEDCGMLEGYRFNSSLGRIPFRKLMNYDGLSKVS